MRILAVAVLAALAGCNSGQPTPTPSESEAAVSTETPAPMASESPTPASSPPVLTPVPEPTRDLAVLDSRDCRTVAQAYVDAIARRDFVFAARVWNDPVIDAARLQALFAGYGQPLSAIGKLQEEGAAGSLYCTVTGTLTDKADAATAPRPGEIVLRRVNDVPGARPAQLRWTIRSSTFVEKMERSGKGAPA
jgi:hypothetical protein